MDEVRHTIEKLYERVMAQEQLGRIGGMNLKRIPVFLLMFEFLCVVIAIIAAIDRNPLAAGVMGLIGFILLVIRARKIIDRLDKFQRGVDRAE